MNSPEFFVIVVNLTIIFIAYFLIYPVLCGSSWNKSAINDFYATVISLLIVGFKYWGAGVEFDILFASLNWFWFALLTYFFIEIPLMLWYFNKHDVWQSFKP